MVSIKELNPKSVVFFIAMILVIIGIFMINSSTASFAVLGMGLGMIVSQQLEDIIKKQLEDEKK